MSLDQSWEWKNSIVSIVYVSIYVCEHAVYVCEDSWGHAWMCVCVCVCVCASKHPHARMHSAMRALEQVITALWWNIIIHSSAH